jgi:hypothetical protein
MVETIRWFLELGGAVVAILLVLSVFAVAIIVLKFWQFWREGVGRHGRAIFSTRTARRLARRFRPRCGCRPIAPPPRR